MKTIEVSERWADRHYVCEPTESGNGFVMKEYPKYHAQIKDRPGVWACGISIDDAIGNLVRTHAETFQVEIAYVGKQHR